MHILGYVIALAIGYWMRTLADQQKNFTKTLGKILSWIVIIVCLVGPFCRAVHHWRACHSSAACSSWKGCHGDSKDKGDKDDKDSGDKEDSAKDSGK